jgi:dTDP-L-rhamnose 4-epimerase
MKSRQVLITGGAGVIGAHLADPFLERGHRVRVLACLGPHVHGAARAELGAWRLTG